MASLMVSACQPDWFGWSMIPPILAKRDAGYHHHIDSQR
jgi:hypothetical protein